MDPTANHAEQVALAASITDAVAKWEDAADSWSGDDEHDAARELAYDAERLAELVTALDGWLRSGGALPAQWERQPGVIG